MWISKKGKKLNINNIKNKIKSLIGVKLKIRVNLGRNKHEYYEGFIDKMHPNLFTINTDKGLKSFSYSDIVTKTVILSKFN